jgi:acetyl/propionyl-CoA carboxylase alpha subunit
MKRFVSVRPNEVEHFLNWSGDCTEGILHLESGDEHVSAEWVEGGLSLIIAERVFFIERVSTKRYRINGREMHLDLRSEIEHRFADFGSADEDHLSQSLDVPMPGRIVKILVSEGDEITSGQGLVIVEAMKMENELKANHPARIAKICVTEGESVEKGSVLIEFE